MDSNYCSGPRCARPPSTQSTVEWPNFFSGQESRNFRNSLGCRMAATHHQLPTLPKAVRRCGRFRTQSHGSRLRPLPKPEAFAMIRSTERLGDGSRPCGAPGCNASTPQRPDRDGQSCACRAPPHRCALLSYPAEIKDQSKIRGYDEGEYTMWQRCGSTFLASQRASPPPGRGLWCFSGPALCARFPRCSISRNRSGRHGLERTPSPAPEFQKVRASLARHVPS